MNKKKAYILGSLLVFIVGVILFAGKSLSTFTSKDGINNRLNTGSVDIEVYEPGWKNIDNAQFNKEYTKEVSIKNSGKSDVYIRVALFPRWVNSDGSSWLGDTSGVKLTLDLPLENWIDKQGDSYYYYKVPIKPGNYTDKLLSKISINVDENLKERYKDKTLVIDVKGEGVLATSNKNYITAWK